MWASLKTDGTYEQHEGVPNLDQMQAIVAGPNQAYGLVEVVQLKHGIDMWINEEGKYEFPVRNDRATMLAHEARSIFAADFICGDVLFTGGADDDGDTVGLSPEQLEYVSQVGRIHEIGFPGSGIWNMTGIHL